MAFSSFMTLEIRSDGSDSNAGGFNGGALVATPSAPTVVGSGTGGSVAAGTYYCIITLVDERGQTSKSAETSVVLTGATSSFTVTAPAADLTSFLYWRLFVGTASGGPYFVQGSILVPGSNRVVTATPATSGEQPPGTDYSQQTAAQISFTDLVIGTPNTTATSAANPLTPAMVGNLFNITAGVNFTVQRRELTGCTAAGVGTFDAALGTIGSTGGTAAMGGALLSPGIAGSLYVSGNPSVGGWVRGDGTTYNMSTTNNVAAGRVTLTSNGSDSRPAFLRGYGTTRGDSGRPIFQSSANSVTLITGSASGCWVENIEFRPNGFTGSVAVSHSSGTNNAILGCKSSCANGFTVAGQGGVVADCDVSGYTSTGGINVQAAACRVTNNRLTGGSASGISTSVATGCVITGNVIHGHTAGSGINLSTNSRSILVENNSVYTTSSGAGGIAASGPYQTVQNNVVMTNDVAPIVGPGAGSGASTIAVRNNALYRSGGGAVIDAMVPDSGGNVTLTGDPYVDAAGGDFNLNSTVGAGAAAKTISYPSAWPGLASTTNARDAGVAQTTAAAGGGGPLVGPGRLARS